MSAILIDGDVMDGDVRIGRVLREPNQYATSGFSTVFVPEGEASWKQYMHGDDRDAATLGKYFACSICKGCADPSYMEPTGSRIVRERICFGCDFWLEMIRKDATEYKDRAVRVDGKHYVMGEKRGRDGERWAGFGGAVWNIEFFDGRKERCNNLWSQGDIPERWREQLPDNARFITAKVPA